MTLLVVAFCTVVLLTYDLMVVLFFQDRNATISNTVYQACKRAPVLAFLAGFIMGHLFWPITNFGDAKIPTETAKHTSSDQSNLAKGDNNDTGK